MPTRRQAYLLGCEHLAAAGNPAPRLEAEVLLRYVLEVDRATLYTRWETELSTTAWTRYRHLLDARALGHPVHYLVGEREFMGLGFGVDNRVMIPRPETEVLVEHVLGLFRDHPAPTFVDVGTGSGCIAVSLATSLRGARVFAIDLSAAALEVARANAVRHHVEDRVMFLEGDLVRPLPAELEHQIDAIVSNPPYVPSTQAASLPEEIRDHEPSVALFAPGDGTEIHAHLVAAGLRWLRPAGWLALEVGLGQAAGVAAAMEQDGRYVRVCIIKDLARVDRVVAGALADRRDAAG